MSDLIHDFIFHSARRAPQAEALVYGDRRLDYATLAVAVGNAAQGLLAPALGLARGERVAVYLEKRIENVVAMFGAAPARAPHRAIDADMAAILYTSGSTGKPKGVVLSHRNMVAGANSVASYLGNTADDRLLAVLPLSFDYGLSQLTTAFSVGATAV